MDRLSTIRRNLESVQSRIATATARAGRAEGEVRLVGVSKYVTPEESALLVQAGCRDLGESRPQQLWEKAASTELKGTNVCWHMIGHLQRNKVDQTLPLADLLHSIDSTRLLTAVDASAGKQSLVAKGLLEVNCSGDAEKHGFSPDEAQKAVDSLTEYPNVRITGLMTMAAREGGQETAQKNFAALRELRDTLSRNAPGGIQLSELSMGMSGDFEEAIAEGATIVRVGSALWA